MVKFVLTAEHTYWTPVKVRMPNPDPKRAGQFIEQQFKVQFRRLDLDEAKGISDEVAKIADPAEAMTRQNDLLKAAVLDWDEIEDETGQAIPFTGEALDQVLQNVWALRGLWAAWNKSILEDSGRKGN